MANVAKRARLLVLLAWAVVVLGAQNLTYLGQEATRRAQWDQARANGRTPALRAAERASDEAYARTMVGWTVAAAVGSALIVLVPFRRRPTTSARLA